MISRANDVQGSISGKKFLPKTLLSSFEQTFEQLFMKDAEEIVRKTLIRVSLVLCLSKKQIYIIIMIEVQIKKAKPYFLGEL